MTLTFALSLALVLSALIGVSLGLIGGGGSIITVPILVYVAGVDPKAAITMSLAIVGATSLAGGTIQWRRGNVHSHALVLFGLAGIVGAQAGAPLTVLVPSEVLMILFALLMIAVAARMLSGKKQPDGVPGGDCRPFRCLLTGLGVGVLTGFLGVGGGFLIVPALVAFARLPMKAAVGTSLLIIGLNSVSGFLGHLRGGVPDPALTVAFTAAALVGMAAGLAMARRLHATALKSAFAGLSLLVAAFLLAKNVPGVLPR